MVVIQAIRYRKRINDGMNCHTYLISIYLSDTRLVTENFLVRIFIWFRENGRLMRPVGCKTFD